VSLKLNGVTARDEYLGVTLLKNKVGQAVVIHMAMGDTDVFQPSEIHLINQAGLTLSCGWPGIEQYQATVDFGAVEMDISNYVWSLYGVLVHVQWKYLSASMEAAAS
jgi:hypothetical protein